jgi:hypothetical protein
VIAVGDPSYRTIKCILATALGHIAIRRRHTVLFSRADKLFTRLRAARLDHTVEAEIRRLATIDVLILDLSRPRNYPEDLGCVLESVAVLDSSVRACTGVGIFTDSPGKRGGHRAVGISRVW